MIIVKYGDLKKKHKKTRWNAKFDECGCKVIVEKEDTEKFRQEIDYEGCPYTEFTWARPFCHETQVYNEYDSKLDQVKETLSDWHDSFKDWVGIKTYNLMDHPIILIFLIMALVASFFLRFRVVFIFVMKIPIIIIKLNGLMMTGTRE